MDSRRRELNGLKKKEERARIGHGGKRESVNLLATLLVGLEEWPFPSRLTTIGSAEGLFG
jgi:hypothetical protein